MRSVAAIALLLVAACSTGSPATDEVANKDFLLDLIVDSASTVVVADLVDDGASGQVAIRPTLILKGSLPVDVDGIYRFDWHYVPDTRPGIWVFGEDGLPFWGDPSYVDEFDRWPDPDIPEFPWNTVDNYVAEGDNPANVTANGALGREFPDAVVAEGRRVLDVADLVVELTAVLPIEEWVDGLGTAKVTRVLKGDGSVAVGDVLTFEYTNPDDQLHGGDLGLPMVWALQREASGWKTVPTWWESGYQCDTVIFAAVSEMYPDYVPSTNPDYGEYCTTRIAA